MKTITDITIVLDRSGSMQSICEETISGFNQFIRKQKQGEGEIRLSLIQFDDVYEKVYDFKKIAKVDELNAGTFVPRGCTALLDAIGRSIVSAKERHNELLGEGTKPKVFFVIITDGHENASVEYNKESVMKKIKQAENKDKWEFIYLGANQDAISVAENIGISATRAMTFAADSKGATDMFQSVSENLYACAQGECEEFEFTAEQRKAQKR